MVKKKTRGYNLHKHSLRFPIERASAFQKMSSHNKLVEEEEQEKIQQELLKKLDTSAFVVHKMAVDEAASHLKTNISTGLSLLEVETRISEYGPNELDAEEEKTLWERIVEQFEDILVRILLASATISFVIAITGKLALARRTPAQGHAVRQNQALELTSFKLTRIPRRSLKFF